MKVGRRYPYRSAWPRDGEMAADLSLYNADVAKFGGMPWVKIYNIPEMTPGEISNILKRPRNNYWRTIAVPALRRLSEKTMTYYKDLSEYSYHGSAFYCPGTKNVGWLGLGHEFEQLEPTDEILNKIWDFCKISVAQMRGIHECEFCHDNSYYAERNGERLLLGTSEIRVLSRDGAIYAAPTLIYHYMKSHNYKPPDEFIRALKEGPTPSSQEYFDRLRELGLEWNRTSAPSEKPVRFRSTPQIVKCREEQ